MQKSRLIAVMMALVVVVAGCTYDSTQSDEVSCAYGGGPFESPQKKDELGPGSGRTFIGMMDDTYHYPTSQRTYDITPNEGEGDEQRADLILAPSSDDIRMEVGLIVRFKLNTNIVCEFHEQVGRKYDAWTDDGWRTMLRETFRRPLERSIQETVRRNEGRALYSSADLLIEVERQIGTGLKDNINRTLGDDYFCGPGFQHGEDACPEFEVTLTHLQPSDPSALVAFEAVEIEKANTAAAQQKVLTAEQEALAIVELQEALANGGGAVALLEAVRSGQVEFWVIDSGELTIQAPPPGGDEGGE
jgi:hypothetical protein